MLLKCLPEVALQKREGTKSENTSCPIIHMFGCYFWKAIAPEESNRGTPELELEVQRVCSLDRRPGPLPIIYMYGASTSDYTCHPNIHYSLFNFISKMYTFS